MLALIQKRKYHKGKREEGLSQLNSTSLALALDAVILTKEIKPIRNKYFLFINWGLSEIPWLPKYLMRYLRDKGDTPIVLNEPDGISNAVNKKTTFDLLDFRGVSIPPFTTSIEVAKEWFSIPKARVFCRTLISSSQGNGIVIASSPEELVPAPLYTLRVPKKWELRAHVFKGEVFHLQQKRKMNPARLLELGIPDNQGFIRSWNNGYRYSPSISDSISEEVRDRIAHNAIEAVASLGLDFGAVDVIVSRDGDVYVLEVNTAPGIEGETVNIYADKFEEYFKLVDSLRNEN